MFLRYFILILILYIFPSLIPGNFLIEKMHEKPNY